MFIDDNWFDVVKPVRVVKELMLTDSGLEQRILDIYELRLDRKRGKCWLSAGCQLLSPYEGQITINMNGG